jgi:ribonuclease D
MEFPRREDTMADPTPQVSTTRAWAQNLIDQLVADPVPVSDADLAVLRAQAAELASAGPLPAAASKGLPAVLRSEAEIRTVSHVLAESPVVCVDLETSDLDHRRGEIVGVGLAVEGGTYYVPTGHRFQQTGELLPDQVPPVSVARALGLGRLRLAAHNAKFELQWLRRHTGMVPLFVWDTMVAARLLRSDLPADLKALAARDLDVPDWSLSNQDLQRIQFLPIDRVARYCALDVWYTLQIMRRQEQCLA